MKNTHKALALAGVFLASNVQAEITFNGFASIVGGLTTSSDETLYGYDNNFDFKEGSLFALQASSDLGDGLSVTAQILSRGEDDWSPEFEWAYVAYEANDNLRLLAGRQRIPFYMYSDFLDVSYAYAWIRPPAGVYSVPFDTFDGLGAIYSGNVGEFDTTLHVIYGGNSNEIDLGGGPVDPKFNDLFGASFTVTRDWLTLRAAYFQTDMNVPTPTAQPLIDAWNLTPFSYVSDNIEVSGDTGDFIELGFQVNYEGFQVVGEFTQLTLDGTTLPDQDSYYIMVGKQFDSILAHITYGANDNTKARITGGVPSGIPVIDYLVNQTNGITDGGISETNYITVGLRWDFHDSAALKFEYTSYSDDLNGANDAGLFQTAIVTVF
jgi:hypothetical protein